MARRLEFVEGTSAKFWEIAVDGTDVTVRYGRLGTEGQELTKSFPDVAAAEQHVGKLVAQKLGKGYQEAVVR